MRLRQLTWLRPIALLIGVLVPLQAMVMAQEAVTARLDPVGESEVTGTATLMAVGYGTNVTLDIRGLASGEDALAAMHAGTCDMPSASFAALPDLKADGTGRATATGSVLFRGTENVALATMADGEHIIAVRAGGQVVACGVIPKLTSASPPPTLPVTGVATLSVPYVTLGVLGSCALFAGLFLWRRSRSRSLF